MAGQTLFHGKELLKTRAKGELKHIIVIRKDGKTKLFDVHPLVEAFNEKHGTNLKVISPNVADIILNFTQIWERFLPEFCFPVDASIAYEKPGVKLEKEIVFSAKDEPRVILATGMYKGEKNVALVALSINGKDFKKDGTSIVLDISDDRLICVPRFPAPYSRQHRQHIQTGVPYGAPIKSPSHLRYPENLMVRTLRRYDTSYVGLIVRQIWHSGWHQARRTIVARSNPSWDFFNVLAEDQTPEKTK